MRWQDNIKKSIIDRVLEAFEKVVSHPNFKHDENFSWAADRYNIREIYLQVANGSPLLETLRENYSLDYPGGRNALRSEFEYIISFVNQDLARLAKIRAQGWLESIMGAYSDRITNQEIHRYRVLFDYRGLTYDIGRGNVRISTGRRWQIDICILPNDDTLPFHDHAANVFLAIIKSPEGLDVLNFGMQLGDILKTNNIVKIISIFSPFNKSNGENREFTDFLYRFKLKDETYPLLYEKINELYKEIFGVYWEDS